MNAIRKSHAILIMTPKCHKPLDPLRKPSSYTFSIIKRDKQAMIGNTKSSLFKSIGCIIVLAQCFTVMPVHGILDRDISYIKFKWLSLKTLYTAFGICGCLLTTLLYVVKFFNSEKEFVDIASIIFFFSAAICGWLFVLVARNWLKLNEKWLHVEYFMRNYSYQPNIERRFKVTAGIIMVLALGEHILSVINLAYKTNSCPLAKTDPVKAYFGVAFSHLFTYIPYSGWYSFLMEIIIITSTFTWNFNDLFIILLCSALAERFKQINKRITNSKDKTKEFWKEIREDYTRLSILCKSLNGVICHIVTIAFGNDVFFICLQLFHTLKPLEGTIDTIYFVCSFGFLLGRTAALSSYCCWVNDESKITLTYLYDIPTEDFGTEASRLIQQITFYPGVITGSNYFEVTRGLCLQVLGAIITFELILFQVGPMLVKTDNNAKLFCVN